MDFKKLLLIGCSPPYMSSESRVGILTNSMILLGIVISLYHFIVLTISGYFESIALWYFGYFMFAVTVMVLQYFKVRMLARILGLVVVSGTGFLAAYLFGKSFNSYQLLFLAIPLSASMFVKFPHFFRILLLTVPVFFIPIIDWLSRTKAIPVLDIHSKDFGILGLWQDSLIIVVAIVLVTEFEKRFANQFEDELTDLNKKLEGRVQRRTASLLEAKEEAIQASLMKSQFVANTSHELKSPVQGISGFLDMATVRLEKLNGLSEGDQKIYEKVRSSLVSAEISSNRLLKLIDRLLKLTITETMSHNIKVTRFSLLSLAEGILKEFLEDVEKKSLEVMLKIDSSLMINSGEDSVRESIHALISNAVKYSNEGSVIKVEATAMKDNAVLTVENVGVGVPDEDFEKIFEPFVQGSKTDDLTGGTGLGLALGQRYARSVNGDVSIIDGDPNKTVFQLDIPRVLGVAQGGS